MEIIRELLGVNSPETAALMAAAGRAFGSPRAERCEVLIRASRLTRRSEVLGAVAALVVGTRILGEDWWKRPRLRPAWLGQEADTPPDEVIASSSEAEQRNQSTLELLAYWIEDDAADVLWGAPAASVDLQSGETCDRIIIPPGARAGDRVVVEYDTGSRLDAVISAGSDGSLHSELDIPSARHSPPSEASWGWTIAGGLGPHRLPSEGIGRTPDPYAAQVDEAAALRLRKWAIDHGGEPDLIGQTWKTISDAVRAIDALYLIARDPTWYYWWRAADAMVDGDAAELDAAMVQISG